MIPVFRPSFGDEELEALREPFESGWIGMGPKTEQFEEEFARYVGADHAIAVNSGTAALHLALLASGIGPGDEVLVPTMTFISTAHAVSYCGAKPVFVDVASDTLNSFCYLMAENMTARTRAVIPVHYGGHPCSMTPIWEWAKLNGLKVIEDAAHACGSRYCGSRIGGLRSEATCFSFHAVKNLATGDGGMMTTNDGALASHVRRLRWCGINKSTWDRTARAQTYGWYYEVPEVGYKCHMNDIAAAIGLVQLGKLDAANAKRRRIVERYNEAFEGLDWITTPVQGKHVESSCHNYVIKTDHRDELHVYLKDHGVATGVHYMPLHLQPCYYDPNVKLPVAEAVWTKLLSLPIYPDLREEQQDYIIERILEFGEIEKLMPLERAYLKGWIKEPSHDPVQTELVVEQIVPLESKVKLLEPETKVVVGQIVPLERRHLEELRAIRSDPEISKWLISPSGHISAAAQERWFEGYVDDPTYRIWVLQELGSRVRGYGQLSCIDLFHQSAELGVVVAPDDQGAGRGRTMIRGLLKIADEELGMRRVWLKVFDDNERAVKAYRACGFSIEGTLRDTVFKDGEFRTLVMMSRLSTDG